MEEPVTLASAAAVGNPFLALGEKIYLWVSLGRWPDAADLRRRRRQLEARRGRRRQEPRQRVSCRDCAWVSTEFSDTQPPTWALEDLAYHRELAHRGASSERARSTQPASTEQLPAPTAERLLAIAQRLATLQRIDRDLDTEISRLAAVAEGFSDLAGTVGNGDSAPTSSIDPPQPATAAATPNGRREPRRWAALPARPGEWHGPPTVRRPTREPKGGLPGGLMPRGPIRADRRRFRG